MRPPTFLSWRRRTVCFAGLEWKESWNMVDESIILYVAWTRHGFYICIPTNLPSGFNCANFSPKELWLIKLCLARLHSIGHIFDLFCVTWAEKQVAFFLHYRFEWYTSGTTNLAFDPFALPFQFWVKALLGFEEGTLARITWIIRRIKLKRKVAVTVYARCSELSKDWLAEKFECFRCGGNVMELSIFILGFLYIRNLTQNTEFLNEILRKMKKTRANGRVRVYKHM